MKLAILPLGLALILSSCATAQPGSNSARVPAGESELSGFAEKAAFDLGNKYCSLFSQVKTEGSDPALVASETRVYRALCASPEALFSPLQELVDKARFAMHLLILEKAAIGLEGLNSDWAKSAVYENFRTRSTEKVHVVFYRGSPWPPFKEFVIKEGLATEQSYEEYWEAFSSKARSLVERIQTGNR